MMTGRGGYYGSAYQAFSEHVSRNNMPLTPDGAHSFSDAGRAKLLPTTPSTSSKLDEILSLLHDQEARLSSLTSEVYTYGVWPSY